jgi:RND family efflux transporter MFP subunit
MKKRITIILVVLGVIALVGMRVWQVRSEKQQADAGQRKAGPQSAGRIVSVSLTEARHGEIRDDIEITGALKPKEQVDISSKVTGRVRSVTVEVGEFVRKGEVIAELETDELRQQVNRAEAALAVVDATLAQRKAELSRAQSDLDRAQQLLDAGLVARQEFDATRTSHQVLEAQLALTKAQREQASAELRELKIQLEQMRIQAPISGHIAQRFVDIGAVVSPATPIARVVNLSTLVTLANVPERQIGKLRPGTRATVVVDAVGDTPFEGRVARIGPVLDASTRTALVEIEIPNPSYMLRAEMFARVKLDLSTMRNAVLIPRESLVYRGSRAGVFVVEQQRPQFRAIETGLTQGQHVEVLGNLAAGTRIVSRGASLLEEGDQIRVVEQTEAGHIEDPKPRTRSGSAVPVISFFAVSLG